MIATAAPRQEALGVLEHALQTLRLAVPVMFARAGLVILITVDTVMTGAAGGNTLAYYGASLAPHITMLTVGIGLLTGTVVFVAQMAGAGRPAECGRIWRRALGIAATIGTVYLVLLLFGREILRLLGQHPDVVEEGGRALILFGPGMPAMLMYVATSFFLEGIGRPKPGMVITLSANLVNAVLNWAMIFGHLGLPAMGAAGATLATSITRWWMFATILVYVLTMRDRRHYGVTGAAPGRPAVGVGQLMKLGVPFALAIGIETSTFSGMAALAGIVSVAALAAYQVALNYMALVYMLALGLATATAIRVANAVGRRDAVGLRRAGWVGTGLVAALMLTVGMATWIGREAIALTYTHDPAVVALAAAALGIAALITLLDGTQGVLIGALRGASDALVPTLIYGLSFWLISLPIAWWFGVRLGVGVPALMWSLFAGLAVATLLLAWRFHGLSIRLFADGAWARPNGSPRP
jgi:MATE family multidrug resistance protein